MKAGITSGKNYTYLAFWCKYGERASVAAGEVTAVLLMHLPGVRIVVEHVHNLHWDASPGCHGTCGACRPRPLDQPECAEALQELLTAFVAVWHERGGRRITHTLGDFQLNEEEDTEGEEDVDAEPAAGRIQAKEEQAEESRPASSSGPAMTKHQAPVPPLRLAPGPARPPPRALGRDLAPSDSGAADRGRDRSRTPRRQLARAASSPSHRGRRAHDAQQTAVDERSFLRIIEDVPLFSVEQCRLLYGALRQRNLTLSRMHHRASQTEEADAPVPGVDQAVQTDAAVPAVPAHDPGAPAAAIAPAPAPAAAVPAVAAGDHPLAAEFGAILDAEWPAYSDRAEALYTAAYDRARRRDAGVPPALVDIRREQSPAQVVTTMRVKTHDAAAYGFPSAWGTEAVSAGEDHLRLEARGRPLDCSRGARAP